MSLQKLHINGQVCGGQELSIKSHLQLVKSAEDRSEFAKATYKWSSLQRTGVIFQKLPVTDQICGRKK